MVEREELKKEEEEEEMEEMEKTKEKEVEDEKEEVETKLMMRALPMQWRGQGPWRVNLSTCH